MPSVSHLAVDVALFCASVLSGMLGIGVAFAAIPILSIHGGDLVHELQPVALFLNGVTALFAAIAFARAGYVDWGRCTWWVSAVATIFSPIGAYVAHLVETRFLWGSYMAAVVVVLLLLLIERPGHLGRHKNWLAHALLAAGPISLFSGMLGVGPGFLLVPALIFLGMTPRSAAAMNAVAVVPSSFSALIPHVGTADIDPVSYVPIVLIAASGALIGGHLASYRVGDRRLRYLFVTLLFCLALYKGITLYGPRDLISSYSDLPCNSTVIILANVRGNSCPH